MPLVVCLLIPIVVQLLISRMNRDAIALGRGMEEHRFVVRQPKIALWVGAADLVFFGGCMALMTFFPNGSEEWWVYLGFLLFALLGVILVLYYLRWEVRVQGSEIRYTPLIGRAKTFSFRDIQRIVRKQNSQYQQVILYSESGRLLSMESNCPGYHVFADRLAREEIGNQ